MTFEEKIKDYLKNNWIDVCFLFIFVAGSLYIQKASYFQGRFDMCSELEKVYLFDDSCVNYDLYQMEYNYSNKPKTNFHINWTG